MLNHLKLIAVIAGLACMVFAAASCQKWTKLPVNDPSKQSLPPLDAQKTDHATANTHLVATITDLTSLSQYTKAIAAAEALRKSAVAHVQAAADAVAAADKRTEEERAIVTRQAKDSVDLQNKLNELTDRYNAAQTKITKLEHQFWSPTQIRWAWAIGITLAMSGLAFGFLRGPAAIFPLVSGFRRLGLWVVTGSVMFWHDIGNAAAQAYNKWHATPGTPAPVVGTTVAK